MFAAQVVDCGDDRERRSYWLLARRVVAAARVVCRARRRRLCRQHCASPMKELGRVSSRSFFESFHFLSRSCGATFLGAHRSHKRRVSMRASRLSQSHICSENRFGIDDHTVVCSFVCQRARRVGSPSGQLDIGSYWRTPDLSSFFFFLFISSNSCLTCFSISCFVGGLDFDEGKVGTKERIATGRRIFETKRGQRLFDVVCLKSTHQLRQRRQRATRTRSARCTRRQ